MLLAITFAAVVVTLVKITELLRLIRTDVAALHEQTQPLLERMETATVGAEAAIGDARADLERFDRVLGSAEALGEAMSASSKIARTALSAPAIKAAGLATGTSRAVRRLRGGPPSLTRGSNAR